MKILEGGHGPPLPTPMVPGQTLHGKGIFCSFKVLRENLVFLLQFLVKI